jgi:uncharacterized protein YaiE (UPF0345 family)
MALFVEFKPLLGEIARSLRIISHKGFVKPTAGTQALGSPLTLAAGFSKIFIKKTNASGTVTITFPDATTFVLTADGEEFEISAERPLGEFEITVASGATYKFYTA